MKNSFMWRNANVLRFIPLINFLLACRFHILVYRGYFTRGKLYLISLAVGIFCAVTVIPAVLLGLEFGFIKITACVINPIILHCSFILFDTLAIREEKRVRDSGFFWSPDEEDSSKTAE